MELKESRKDFPILKNRNVIYFDKAATSLKPYPVIEAVNVITKSAVQIYIEAYIGQVKNK